MSITKKLLFINLLAFQACFTCENNNQDQPKKKYTKEQLLQIRNQMQNDPDYQKKINEIKEQLLRILGNQIRSRFNSPIEDQNSNLENAN